MTNKLNVRDAGISLTTSWPLLRRASRTFNRRPFPPKNAQDDQEHDRKTQPFKKLRKLDYKVLWRRKKSIIGADASIPTTERPKAHITKMKSNSTPMINQWKKSMSKKASGGPKLNYIKSALRILAAVGDGVAPVPGLKGVAGIALEIVRVVEVIYFEF